MFEGISPGDLLAMLLPLVALQLGLALYCVVRILRKGTANLNKPVWCAIVLLVNLIGPIAFLLFGRRKDA